MSAWSVKTRRAPSRHCRDAGVYGHTATAMHDNEYPFPPPPIVALFQAAARERQRGDRPRDRERNEGNPVLRRGYTVSFFGQNVSD